MKKNKIAIQIGIFACVILGFVACNEDFSSLESDVVNRGNATNFDIKSEKFDVITYTDILDPVQTNNMVLNTLGIYKDNYGTVTSNFLTQLNLSSYSPDFGDGVKIDSVVMTLPFFSEVTSTEEDGTINYQVDSVINNNDIKLQIFESNYFLRSFNPNNEFNDPQAFFSNMSASSSEPITSSVLEQEELIFVDHELNGDQKVVDNTVAISNNGIELKGTDDNGDFVITERLSPGIRVKLDSTFWRKKIIDQQDNESLSDVTNFTNFFRGLYIKAEPIDNKGSFMFLNMSAQSSNITIYYSRLTPSTEDADETRDNQTFQIFFGPTRVNFFQNELALPTVADTTNGDSRLFLKGGEGAVAKIKLFNGENTDTNNTTSNTFEAFKNEFVETDSEGNFVKSKRLINEANLIFYVDNSALNAAQEPDRLVIYDVKNQRPLQDYFFDIFDSNPDISVVNHLGRLQRVDNEPDGDGIKYKIEITEHINNLLLRDSTNVELGLAVSLNVNLEQITAQSIIQTSDDSDIRVPSSAVLSPRGTVLHGNASEDPTKRVQLEIFYTEPNN